MEDELHLGGKKYVSSKKAAAVTGYAKDYIGQLCRGNKLEAKLIGRNWYITLDSLAKIRKKHLLDQLGALKLADMASKPPVPKTSNLLDELDVAFFSDDTPLIPELEKKQTENSHVSIKISEKQDKKILEPIEYKEQAVIKSVDEAVVNESSHKQAVENDEDAVEHPKSSNFLRTLVQGMVVAAILTALTYPLLQVNFHYEKKTGIQKTYTISSNLAGLIFSKSDSKK